MTKLLFVSIKISRYEIFKILKVLSNQDYLVNFEDFEGACSLVLAVADLKIMERGNFSGLIFFYNICSLNERILHRTTLRSCKNQLFFYKCHRPKMAFHEQKRLCLDESHESIMLVWIAVLASIQVILNNDYRKIFSF